MRRDDGVATVVEVGLASEDAQGYQHLADASRAVLYQKPQQAPSALETFGGPAQQAEDAATLKRLQAKADAGHPLHRSERAFLAKHEPCAS